MACSHFLLSVINWCTVTTPPLPQRPLELETPSLSFSRKTCFVIVMKEETTSSAVLRYRDFVFRKSFFAKRRVTTPDRGVLPFGFSKAVIYRKYRDGELPDIQIKLGDVLRPLQHLSMLDGGIAREVFVQIFKVNEGNATITGGHSTQDPLRTLKHTWYILQYLYYSYLVLITMFHRNSFCFVFFATTKYQHPAPKLYFVGSAFSVVLG